MQVHILGSAGCGGNGEELSEEFSSLSIDQRCHTGLRMLAMPICFLVVFRLIKSDLLPSGWLERLSVSDESAKFPLQVHARLTLGSPAQLVNAQPILWMMRSTTQAAGLP
jgi:hypothetical protein